MALQITRRSGLLTLMAAPLLEANPTDVADTFPSQPAELVRETVIVATPAVFATSASVIFPAFVLSLFIGCNDSQ